MSDMVNHPPHYNSGKIECIDAIESATIGKSGFEAYLVGNIMKYLWRYNQKNGIEDLKKAQWYLNKLVEVVQKRETGALVGKEDESYNVKFDKGIVFTTC